MNMLGLGIHGMMLADKERNTALAVGIESLVRPGDVVIDVGAGTAILSMLAARAGARRVYALEVGSMAAVARHLVDRNGYNNVITVVHASSFDFVPPESADLILCETLGFIGLDEGFRPTLVDARNRMLHPNGRLLPASVQILVAPIAWPTSTVELTHMDTILGLDFSPLADVLRRIYRRCYISKEDELASPMVIFEFDCYQMSDAVPLEGEVEFMLNRCTQVAGFGLWFVAELASGVMMSSRSPLPSNHWGQAFLPLPEPISAEPGDRFHFHLMIDDRRRRFHITWHAERLGIDTRPHIP